MPGGVVSGFGAVRCLSGINDNWPFGMLNQPRKDRQRVRPLPVEQGVDEPQRPAATSAHLALMNPYGSRLNSMNTHRVLLHSAEKLRTRAARRRFALLGTQSF